MSRTESPQRILLIEDSPADVMLLRMAMEEVGVSADVTVCQDGEEAIAHIGSEADPPDIVLLDLNIPCRDGMEVLETIRSSNAWPETPVLVFTSALSPPDEQRVGEYGASILRKPRNYGGFVKAAAEIARAGKLSSRPEGSPFTRFTVTKPCSAP